MGRRWRASLLGCAIRNSEIVVIADVYPIGTFKFIRATKKGESIEPGGDFEEKKYYENHDGLI